MQKYERENKHIVGFWASILFKNKTEVDYDYLMVCDVRVIS